MKKNNVDQYILHSLNFILTVLFHIGMKNVFIDGFDNINSLYYIKYYFFVLKIYFLDCVIYRKYDDNVFTNTDPIPQGCS